MIMTYYSVIGGWITEYLAVYLAGQGVYAAEEGYFTSFITAEVYPIIFMLLKLPTPLGVMNLEKSIL